MDPDRVTGFVYPVKKNGVLVRGRWQLWVNLPPESAFDKDGQPVLDAKGRQKQRYPKTTKVVEVDMRLGLVPVLVSDAGRAKALSVTRLLPL